jgi:hypothetical protein
MNVPLDTAAAIAEVEARLNAPDYRPQVYPAAHIAKAFGLTRAAVTNWGARTARTGVHRHPGGYDINEVLRWFLIRPDDGRTRTVGHADDLIA